MENSPHYYEKIQGQLKLKKKPIFNKSQNLCAAKNSLTKLHYFSKNKILLFLKLLEIHIFLNTCPFFQNLKTKGWGLQ